MASGSFRRWERAMFVFLAITLAQIPMLLLSHPDWGRAAHDFVLPGIRGGLSSDAVLLIIAIVGTTVAPWQLFFQQSNIIDKRITPRFIGYERADTILGAIVVVIGAAALMMTADDAALLQRSFRSPSTDMPRRSHSATAAELGLSPAAVRQRCSRAIRRLRTAVAEQLGSDDLLDAMTVAARTHPSMTPIMGPVCGSSPPSPCSATAKTPRPSPRPPHVPLALPELS